MPTVSVREHLQEGLKEVVNRQLIEEKKPYTCLSVNLVQENTHKYTGFEEFSNGRKIGIKILIYDNGREVIKRTDSYNPPPQP